MPATTFKTAAPLAGTAAPLLPLGPLGPLLTPRHVLAGGALFTGQDRFRHRYSVRSGALKSSVSLPDGREQVCGFHLAGDLLGLDGLADGVHHHEVLALEDSQVCVLQASAMDAELRRCLSVELLRGQLHLLLLGQMTAIERVGAFVLDLSQRARGRGESACCLHLCMARSDIGSYLGITLETVSRALSQLKDTGFIDVDNRRVVIHDWPAFTAHFQLRGR